MTQEQAKIKIAVAAARHDLIFKLISVSTDTDALRAMILKEASLVVSEVTEAHSLSMRLPVQKNEPASDIPYHVSMIISPVENAA